MDRNAKQVRSIAVLAVHHIILCIMLSVMVAGYIPFIASIFQHNRGTVIEQPLEPACQNKCVVSVHRSSVDNFDSFFLDSTQALFVHFSGYNFSLNPADTTDITDILDPLNLVYVDNIKAPFLLLGLGFNAYSLSTLSRDVHHMKVKVEVEPSSSCSKNLSRKCVTTNLARTFLGNVTKQRGVLCYAVNDSNTVNYRCCKGNVHTQQVECDIPPVLSLEMAIIFITITIAAGIALLCFPVHFNIVSDKKHSKTLCTNNQVHNPLCRLIISAIQALRHYSTEYYWVNVIRKLLIGLALPMLFYIDLLRFQRHTKNNDIPEMFNDAVKNLWIASKAANTQIHNVRMLFIIICYNIVVFMASFLPRNDNLEFRDEGRIETIIWSLLEQEKEIKGNWKEPFVWTKDFVCCVGSNFRNPTSREKSFRRRFGDLLVDIALVLLSPVIIVITILIPISYVAHVSPLWRTMRSHFYHLLFQIRYLLRNCCVPLIFIVDAVVVLCAWVLFLYAFEAIFLNSVLFSARLIVYLWMGLVGSKDYYFPRIAVFSVFAYYCWNCSSSVKSKYQILLKQTYEKCKEHQEKQPNGREPLTYDDKGVPSISSELFQHVIDEILPRSEVYTNMMIKLSIIISFLCLAFSSILIYVDSNYNESLALVLAGILPKLFEVFGERSSYQQLLETENACRVEKIVKDFLNQSIANSYIYQSTLEECDPVPEPADSNDDLITEETPLLP